MSNLLITKWTYSWSPCLLPLAIRLGEGCSELLAVLGSDMQDLRRVVRVPQVLNAAKELWATIDDERWFDRGGDLAPQTQVLEIVVHGLSAGYIEIISYIDGNLQS